MHGNNWNGMGWSMGWGWAFIALMIIGIVVLIIVLVRVLGSKSHRASSAGGSRTRARELLDERYAKGEIDGAEYDEVRRRLDDGG